MEQQYQVFKCKWSQRPADFATLLQDDSNFLIQRGHGVRSKQFSITEDKDILSMYDEYKGKWEFCKVGGL